jgi:hypothetical protein
MSLLQATPRPTNGSATAGGIGVLVGGTDVSVEGTGVSVGGTMVSVGKTNVSVAVGDTLPPPALPPNPNALHAERKIIRMVKTDKGMVSVLFISNSFTISFAVAKR